MSHQQYPSNSLGLPPDQNGGGSRPSASLRRASTYGDNPRAPRQAHGAPAVPLPKDYRMDAPTPRNRLPDPQASNSRARSNNGPPPSKSSGANDRSKSKVGGMLLQKRQSVSYAHAEANGLLSSDAVPALPHHGSSGSKRIQPKRIGAGGLDLDELNREGFDVEAYLRNHFARNKGSAGSNTDVLKTLKANLQGSMDITNQDLQQSVLAYVQSHLLGANVLKRYV